MTLVPLLPIFHSLNRKYFDGTLAIGSTPLVAIRWSDGRLKKTAGLYRRGSSVKSANRCEIVLSRPLLENLPQSALQSTLCHEMIHAWIDLVLGLDEGHGPHFRERMGLINSLENQFQVSIRHKFPVSTNLPKWSAVCPSCHIRMLYKRRVTGAACRKCCNLHNGGSWTANYLLKYESISR